MPQPMIESIPKYINYLYGDTRADADEKPWDEFRRRRIAGATLRELARDFGDVEASTAGRWWRQYLASPEGQTDKEAQAAEAARAGGD